MSVGTANVEERERVTENTTIEEVADELLLQDGSDVRVYTERQLARKMRLEKDRLQDVEETAIPVEAADYLVRRQVELMTESGGLTKLQSAVLAHVIDGWQLIDIARHYGMGLDRLKRQYRIALERIERGGSPWDGLYEVYWREVHRYVYRR